MTGNKGEELINKRYLECDFIEKFSKCFASGTDYIDTESGCCLYNYPFQVAVFPNFINDKEILRSFISEFNKLTFKHKLNDLHDFFQSPDLIKSPLQTFSNISKSLGMTVQSITQVIKSWGNIASRLTNIKLGDNVIDCACQIYKTGGRLLCHDDALEGRRIAYILYLVDEDWKEEDGGALELFTANLETGNPEHPARKITPKYNTLAFFEVTPISYHQVAEVMSKRPRRSMTGWFHGPSAKYGMKEFLQKLAQLYKNHPEIDIPTILPLSIDRSLFFNSSIICDPNIATIHPHYQKHQVLEKMAMVLHDESVIEIRQLLKLPKLDLQTLHWRLCGPANYCHFMTYWRSHDNINASKCDYLSILKFLMYSNDMLSLFKSIMHINIAEHDDTFDATMIKASSIWKISAGDYLLIHDQFVSSYDGYDLYYFLIPEECGIDSWKSSIWGGSIRYSLHDGEGDNGDVDVHGAGNNDATMINIDPCHNSMYIVKRTKSSQRCIDYVKKSSNALKNNPNLFYLCFHIGLCQSIQK